MIPVFPPTELSTIANNVVANGDFTINGASSGTGSNLTLNGTMDFGGYLAFAPAFDAQLSIGSLEMAGSPPVEVAVISFVVSQS